MIKLVPSAITVDAQVGETPRRQISGVAVTYGDIAVVADGTKVKFVAGALATAGKAPKLFMYHDSTNPVGLVTERVEVDNQMLFTAKISSTTQGNEALVLASDGVIDAVSVGVNPIEFTYDDDDVMVISRADWLELSMVPIGAFEGAVITQVNATHNPEITTPKPIGDTKMSEEIIPTTPIPAVAKKKITRLPSAAEYLAAYHTGGQVWANINNLMKDYRSENQSPLEAAAGDVITTDTPGLLPVPVLAPVVQNLNFVRPVVTALGARSMPNTASKTFIRPTITTHTSAALQSAELAAVSATTMVVASNVVTKTTVSGQVTFSQQDLDFTDPSSMSVVLNDLVGEYLIATDNIAADNLLAAATSSGVWDLTVADLITSIYDAAVDVSATTNFFPTHMFVDPATWAKLGKLVDSTNRPVFPAIGSANLIGTNTLGAGDATKWSGMNPLGLELVVDANFAAATMVICNKNAFEIYEQPRGILSVEVPSTLGRTFSYYGYFATFAAVGQMIRKITQ